jgi:hypothetical protein
MIEPKVKRQQLIIGLVSSHFPKELKAMKSLVAEEESDGYLEHLHQRSVWDPAKIFFTSKFYLLTFFQLHP